MKHIFLQVLIFTSCFCLFISCKKSTDSVNNIAPIANAGINQSIELPVNSVQLTGTGTDYDGTIVSYQWVYITGPPSFTIVNPKSANTEVKDLVRGEYLFGFSVMDNQGRAGISKVSVSVSSLSQHPLLPLKKGNNWSYIDKTFKEDGTELSSIDRKAVVIDTVRINNKTYHLLDNNIYNLNDGTDVVRASDSAVYQFNGREEWQWYKWSVKDGEIEKSDVDWNYLRQQVYSTALFTIGNFEGYKITINESYDSGASVVNYTEIFFQTRGRDTRNYRLCS